MEVGVFFLIHGLLNSLVVLIVVPKIESLKVKCEFSYTFGSLLILNKFCSSFIQTRKKYIGALEEWLGEESWLAKFLWYNARRSII